MSIRSNLRAGAMATATLAMFGAGLALPASAQADGATTTLSSASVADIGGTVEWNRDPVGSEPGDALRVCDTRADGIGIEADLIVNGSINRTATTRGHDSPYCSPWKTGDLPEDRAYTVRIYTVSGGVYTWVDDITVYS